MDGILMRVQFFSNPPNFSWDKPISSWDATIDVKMVHACKESTSFYQNLNL